MDSRQLKHLSIYIQRLEQAKAELDAIYHNRTIETLTAGGYKPVEEIYEVIAANVA